MTVKTAIGLMSGTSMDGIDVALLRTDGEAVVERGPFLSVTYEPAFRDRLKEALEEAKTITRRDKRPGDLSRMERELTLRHVDAVRLFLRRENLISHDIDFIGFHGQTLAHDPAGRGTHQAGSGQVLAEVLGVPVVWDFRTADVSMGGQGAPLAPFYHHTLARHIGATSPVAFLNMGGVGNLTWVDPRIADPASPGALLAFDTGPANAPVNALMRARRGMAYDANGALAALGTPDMAIVTAGLELPYFYKMPPKSLDRNDFHGVIDAVSALSDADAVATLTAFAAAGVARAMDHCPTPPSALYVTGGGRHNTTLMTMLAAGVAGDLECPVLPVEEVGLDGDMLEAQAFAFLAMRVKRGLPTSCPATTGARAAIGGGRVSKPSP